LERKTITTHENEIVRYVRTIKGSKMLTFEEGSMSHWLYLTLKDEVDELVVCQPPRKKGGAKTDKIDAFEMADLMRVGRLKSVFHEDSQLQDLRVLVSGYGDLMQDIVRAKNRYKALFRQVAIPNDESGFYDSVEKVLLLPTSEQRFVAGGLYDRLMVLGQLHGEYLARFEANVRKHKPVKLLTSIPGIGAVRANQLVGVMVTPYRFPNKYHFFSYAMLTPHTRMSDGRPYGKNRAQGQTTLKAVFKSATESATRGDTAFRRKYETMIAAGKPHKTARSAVTKMLAATVLGVWKSGRKYDDKHMEVTRRRKRCCHSGTESLRV
jgi:transposase